MGPAGPKGILIHPHFAAVRTPTDATATHLVKNMIVFLPVGFRGNLSLLEGVGYSTSQRFAALKSEPR